MRNSNRTEDMTLPARYSGVRFRHEKRSDGRDIVIETPMKEPDVAVLDAPFDKRSDDAPKILEDEKASSPSESARGGFINSLSGIFGNVGEHDILLAALIIVLAGEGIKENREALLLLILLLCIR